MVVVRIVIVVVLVVISIGSVIMHVIVSWG
jgi:hypothetical protein